MLRGEAVVGGRQPIILRERSANATESVTDVYHAICTPSGAVHRCGGTRFLAGGGTTIFKSCSYLLAHQFLDAVPPSRSSVLGCCPNCSHYLLAHQFLDAVPTVHQLHAAALRHVIRLQD